MDGKKREEREVEELGTEMGIQNLWIEGPICSCQGWVGVGEFLVRTTSLEQRRVISCQYYTLIST